MGTDVNSLFVRNPNAREVGDALARVGRSSDAMEVAAVPCGAWTVLMADPLDDLAGLAGLLSAALGTEVVTALVSDSDAALMRLWVEGHERGRLASPPRFWKSKSIGSIDPWRTLLASDAAAEETQRAWRDPPETLEGLVDVTAMHLGIDRDLATENMHSLDPARPGRLDITVGVPPAREPEAVGPPQLWIRSGPLEKNEIAAGEQLGLFFGCENKGGSGRGLRIAVDGTALDRGVVTIDEVSISEADGWVPIEHSAPPVAIDVDASLRAGPRAEVPMVRMLVRGGEVGEGTFRVSVSPSTHSLATKTVRITTFAPGWRPLHAIADPAAMHDLWRPDSIQAWILLDDPRDRALERAVDMVLGAHELLQLPGDATYRRFSAVPNKRARTASLAASKLTSRAIRTWMNGATMLNLTHQHAARNRGPVEDVIAVELVSIPAERTPEHAVPHLGISVSTHGCSPARVDALEQDLVALVDRIASSGRIRQAFVDRWRGALQFDSTPYESACDVSGSCTTLAWWCDRWLRAVARHLWIGPRVLEHIDLERLAVDFDVQLLGTGVARVSADRAQLTELERHLVPVLPDRAAWQEGVDRLYSRRRAK